MKIACIGEILWDVFPDRARLGGAPFNFAYHAAQLGHQVEFISALGDDGRGRRARDGAVKSGVSTRNVQTTDQAPTGMVTVELDASGEPDYEIHRPAAADFIDGERVTGLEGSSWFYYGTLHQMAPAARAATLLLTETLPKASIFYDVNLRKDSYTSELVRSLVESADLVKLNEHEARELGALFDLPGDPESFCHAAVERFELQGVCVTRGAEGCALLLDGKFGEAPGFEIQCRDAVGAGDAFAAALLDAISRGAGVVEAGEFANRVGALVASLPGGTPAWRREDAARLRT